jgi:hypothetical protein
MTDNLDTLLDECIDRINTGQSLEECLASYPEHAERLEPLLRSILDIRATCSPMPSPAAKAAARRRLDTALDNDNLKRSSKMHRRAFALPLGRPKAWVVMAAVALLAIIAGISSWALIPGGAPAPAFAQANFRLLISDQANAIGDFDHLDVTITSIGVHSASTGEWLNLTLPADPAERTIDLVLLQELNATEIWCGNLTEGLYTMVFLEVGSVIGTLNSGGEQVNVTASSGTLKINKPFVVTNTSQTTFVFDISVVSAGQSGKYNLKPVIGESGLGKQFHLVHEDELTLQVVEGDVTPGENITVLVTLGGDPVEGALVTVNDEEVGTTNETGYISFDVPDAEELVIKATTLDELEGELEIEL